MTTCDVAVVGGGPAGSAAAITLARAGREVVLVDKATFPRDKCCGDGLTTLALRLGERLGLDPGGLPSWVEVDGAVVRSPSGRTVAFPLPDDGVYAAVARRTEYDAALLDLARSAGAKVLDGHALVGAEDAGDHVTLDVEGIGRLRAHFAIGADGMWSPLRRSLGLSEPGYRGEWHAFRQYFVDVGPAAASLHVWFEPDLLPGYAWSFPLGDGAANLGFGIQRGGKVGRIQDMAAIWRELPDRPHIRAVLGKAARPEGRHTAWPIPARIDQATLAAGRALFVGDAAAATDVMTGEGIGQALLTGILAADAIVGGGPSDAAAVGVAYGRSVRHALVADHRMSALLVRALSHRKGARTAVRLAGATDWTRRNFARWLFEDYPRAMVATPGRWHAGMFTGSGAYRRRSPAGNTAVTNRS